MDHKTNILDGIDPQNWQRQWDTFFKLLAPHSGVLRRITERAFDLESDTLMEMKPVATDMSSRRIAQALHMKRPFKDLRSDGIFETSASSTIIGYEYQSTENTGMLLRTYMYEEAFRENNLLTTDKRLEFVVLYSGNDMPPSRARTVHGKIVERNVRHLFIDLNQIRAAELENDDLASLILRLSRKDATDFCLFIHAAERISNEVSVAEERDKLLMALVVASFNKPDLGQRAIRELVMDEDTRKNLERMIPVFNDMRKADMARRGVIRGLKLSKAPTSVVEHVEKLSDDEIVDLEQYIDEYIADENWDAIVPSGFRLGG
ncbi:hypothetical protein [Phyllobacterium sp. K27]